MRNWLCALVGAFFVAVTPVSSTAQTYTVTDLGWPNGANNFFPAKINNAGAIVGCSYHLTETVGVYSSHMHIWSPDSGFTHHMPVPDASCDRGTHGILGFSDAGDVLFYLADHVDPAGPEASPRTIYLWKPPATAQPFTSMASGPHPHMNAAGQVLGLTGNTRRSAQFPISLLEEELYLWDPETGFRTFYMPAVPGDDNAQGGFHALRLNDRGQIAGSVSRCHAYSGVPWLAECEPHAFVWPLPSPPIDLGVLATNIPSPTSYVLGYSNSGAIGWSATSNRTGEYFYWSPTHGLRSLCHFVALPSQCGELTALNNQSIVTGRGGSDWLDWFVLDPSTGLRSIRGLLDTSDPREPVVSWLQHINDRGEIIAQGQIFGQYGGARQRIPYAALLLTPSASLEIELIDPYPDFIRGGVVKDTGGLATKGTIVRGVAADGVATIVLRLKTAQPGQTVVLTVPGDTNENGFLGALGSTPTAQSVTVTSNAQGQAFALYRAPLDFAWRADQHSLATRNVDLTVSYGGAQQVLTINVVRPPIMFVHGLWSNHRTWDAFVPLSDGSDLRFQTYRANYASSEALGITKVSPVYLEQLWRALDVFRRNNSVASAQVDLVAHSMGGLVARAATLYPDYDVGSGFGKGPVHKMITLDTPHLGSGFASQLLAEGPGCKQKFEDEGKPVRQNITDLAEGSPLVIKLAAASGKVSIPTHAVIGVAIPEDQAATEQNWNAPRTTIASWLRHLYCPTLLPPGGFSAVLGPDSDLIVSNKSQRAFQLGRTEVIPSSSLPFVNHAVDNIIFKFGVDVLGRTVINGKVVDSPDDREVIVNQVIVLLNQPVTSPWYKFVRP